MATNNAVNTSLSGQTGTGSFVGSTSPTITTPIIAQINDTNAAPIQTYTARASAVNYLDVQNGILAGTYLTQNITFTATGTSANISFAFAPKGDASLLIAGNATRGGTLALYENTANGTSYVQIKAPESLAGNVSWNLPNADAKGVMQSDGAGSLTLTASPYISGIVDNNGVSVLTLGTTASAVNYMSVINNVTGSPPVFNSNGTDTNIDIGFQSKGTGGYKFFGTATTAAFINLYEDTDNGSNFFKFQAPTSLTGDRTASLPDSNIDDWVVQRVSTQTGTVATGTTAVPADNTIPQIGEGNQYMSLAITPKSTANILKIDVVWLGTHTSVSSTMAVSLFQDATANALATGMQSIGGAAGLLQCIAFTHTMTAGTTSATTFTVRAGTQSGATTTFNGSGGGQFYGGVAASSITITEYTP